MHNMEIRQAIKSSGIKQWQVADRFRLSEGAFIRLLRREISVEKKSRILSIIQELKGEEIKI